MALQQYRMSYTILSRQDMSTQLLETSSDPGLKGQCRLLVEGFFPAVTPLPTGQQGVVNLRTCFELDLGGFSHRLERYPGIRNWGR